MEIVNNTFNKNIDQVKPGELFIMENDIDLHGVYGGIFIKIRNVINNDTAVKFNAVKINDGSLHKIDRNTILHIVNGKLIV